MKHLAQKLKNTIKDEITCFMLWISLGRTYDLTLGALRKAKRQLNEEEENRANQKR